MVNWSFFSLLFLFLVFSPALCLASIEVQIIEQGDTVHFEVGGKNQWDYDLKRFEKEKKTFVEIKTPKISDLSQRKLNAFKSQLIKNITIDSKGPDDHFLILFELVSNKIESFDYLTDQPSRLIVDFFINQDSVEQNKKSKKNDNSNKAQIKKNEIKNEVEIKKKETSVERKPANDTIALSSNEFSIDINNVKSERNEKKVGVFDGGDPGFERFQVKDFEIKEESIIAARENVYLSFYLAFPMLHPNLPYLEALQIQNPVYDIVPSSTDENKQARLLLTLFQKKRYNVFLKTLKWFLEKYPNSQYDEIVRFMWADAHFANWIEGRNTDDFDLAILRYRQVINKYPNSVLTERTMILMGFATLDRGDYFGTLRQFQGHIRNRPNSPNRDIARLGIAEAYLKISRWQESVEQYDEIENQASDPKFKKMASFLRGDVYFKKKDFEKAIAEYEKAMKKYPDSLSEFPNAVFNRAAANFDIGNFRESLDQFNDFLRKFPSDSYSGYAMTRVGELLEILGADKKKSLGAYLETHFRYGDTPGSVVARLHLLSSRMILMKPKEIDKTVKDIQELAKKSELPKIEQFATLMIADGFQKRKEYERAADLLIKYYQSNPTNPDLAIVNKRLIQYINENLRETVDNGKYIEALKLHNKYADSWLKNTDRIDTKFNVARSFELAGAFGESELMYKDAINRIYALKGTDEEKSRNVIERLPSIDEMNLRLANVAYNQMRYSQSYDYLKLIKDPTKLKESQQIERVQLAASLLERKNDFDSANRYLVDLIKEWNGIPELIAEPYLLLAQIEVKMDKKTDAIESLLKIDKIMEESGKVTPTTHAKSLEMLGNLYLEVGKTTEAIEVYDKLLGKYEEIRPLASIRYRLGEIHFKKGENKKASETWNQLKDKKNEFWYKLAQEQLKSSEFGGEYKKYIKRIPAMSSSEPSGTGEIK